MIFLLKHVAIPLNLSWVSLAVLHAVTILLGYIQSAAGHNYELPYIRNHSRKKTFAICRL